MVFKEIMGDTLKIKFIRRIYNILILAVFSLLFSGCYTLEAVQIEVVKPAKIHIPTNVKSLTVLNASLLQKQGKFTNAKQQILYQVDSAITQNLTKNISTLLNESPLFDTCILHKKLYNKKLIDLLKPLKWNDLEQINYHNSTKGILSLEAFSLEDSIQRISEFDGYGYNTYKSLILICSSLWRLYIPEEKSIVEKKIRRDTLYFDEFTSIRGFREAMVRKEARDWLANTISWEIASKESERLAPYWVRVKRDLLNGGNSEMQMATKFAMKDNWIKAAKIWQKYTEDKKPKIAAVACYNMALVCEVQGRIDLALVWLNQSKEHFASPISDNYIKILNYRLKEATILDKQFGQD